MRSFTLDWVSSLSLGIRITGPVEIPAAKQVVDDIEVLGRAGTLTRFLGWHDTIITIPVLIRGTDLGEKYQDLSARLTTAKHLMMSAQPGRLRRIKHAHAAPLVRESATWARSEIIFVCQPFAYLVDNPTHMITTQTTLINPGSIESAPIITVVGTGTLSFTINSHVFTVQSPAGSLTLDSDTLVAHVAGHAQTDGLLGGFPMLAPGANVITPGVGVTRLEVTGNWRTH